VVVAAGCVVMVMTGGGAASFDFLQPASATPTIAAMIRILFTVFIFNWLFVVYLLFRYCCVVNVGGC
jgi:hypothetical protein